MFIHVPILTGLPPTLPPKKLACREKPIQTSQQPQKGENLRCYYLDGQIGEQGVKAGCQG